MIIAYAKRVCKRARMPRETRGRGRDVENRGEEKDGVRRRERERITDNLIKNCGAHEYYIRRGTRSTVILARRGAVSSSLRTARARGRNDFPDFSELH